MNAAARVIRPPRQRWLWAAFAVFASGVACAQSAAPEDALIYRARPRDTLIGIGQRLLIEPRRWSELQARNSIADPRRIPIGTQIRIPYAWLRLSAESATVSALSGEVRNETRNLALGDALAEGSRIHTGADGSVTLALADGSVITLQKSSVLTLEGMRRVTGLPQAHDTRVKLQSGRVQTVAKPQSNMGRFEIRTPVAVSAVRGTQFRSSVEPSGDSGTTETLAGLVAVAGSGAEVSVPADYGTRVERDAAPRPPSQLPPPPDLQTIPATNGANRLVLQWPAVTGAVAYRIQLAPGAEFHSFLADAVSTAAQIDLPAPADGSYWLRVRSIDNFGLEGQDAVRTFAQRLLPAAPALAGPLPDASVVGDGAAFAWADLGPGIRYRVQVARDAGFTDLLLQRDAIEAAQIDVEEVPAGRYFWRVAAVNDRGESGDWSPAQVFTQRRHAPTPDAPAFPARELQLKWQPQEGVRYRVQIARDPEFRTTLHDKTRDEPSLSMRRPRPGVYYARIQTIYPDGGTAPFGEVRKFDVPVPLWLKILLPLAAVAAALA